MVRMKKGMALFLMLVMCFSAVWPYAGRVSASEAGADTNGAPEKEYMVTLESGENGRVAFTDSTEEARAYREGDKVTLEVCPNEGFERDELLILDAKEEAGAQDQVLLEEEEENRLSFIMKDYDVRVRPVFREAEAKAGEPEIGEQAQAEAQEGRAEELQVEEFTFPYEGYLWGKDSGKKDTGKRARLTNGGMDKPKAGSATGSVARSAAGAVLRSAVGTDAVIRPGTNHSYGSWGTCEFTVTTSTGQYLGYCAQPNLGTPDGTYSIAELDNTMIKAALLIAPGGVPQLYENYGKSIYNEADNNVYAYAHALIGYLYMGSLKGLSSSMAKGVENMANVLAQISHNSLDPSYGLFQSYFDQYKVYVACSGSSTVQDIVWIERNPAGRAKLKKISANPQITDGNGCYSLAGARYGVFRDNGCSQQAAVLTTDESGDSDTVSLDAGTYYVKEITAPRGYKLDPVIHPVQVDTGRTAELKVSDEPVVSPPVTLDKVDRETGEDLALGAASLENTQFRVNFYSGHYTKENLPKEPDRTWVVRARSAEAGNKKARSAAEEMMLPLGTISVEEIQAPAGYLLDSIYLNSPGAGVEKLHVAKIIQNGDQGTVEDGTEYVVADSVIRGDFELTKIDKNTQQPIAGVLFRITSDTTKESHVIMTDENGHYSSSTAYAPHSYQTNGGKAGDGLWFGLDENGNSVAVDDTVGALPYDTYTIEELKCEANEGKFLYSGKFTITRAGYTVNLGNVENADIAIQTTAKDEATGTHYASAEEDTAVIDTVSYMGLQKNKKYRLRGTLMNRATGQAVTDEKGNPVTGEEEFTPKDSNGEVEVELFFDASGLEGADVVVYEELYLGDEKLAEHKDINDAGQTIHFPAIGTRAYDGKTDCEISKADEEITIVDTVSYENLRAGRKYKMTGILMDRETGRAVLDENGGRIEAQTSFTAETSDGTVEVIFRFPGRNLAGKTLVAFETLSKDNKEYAVHHDITDEPQTIYIPAIGTKVHDSDTMSHLSRADRDVTLVDEVKYENLVPDRAYVLEGILMDKKSGKPAVDADGKQITAQTVFTPKKSDGSAEVVFRFDGSKLAGETLVVYEELLYQGKVIAEHKEAEDAGQTIYFPSASTTAKDQKTGEQIAFAEDQVTIEDVVHYENLVPGKKYTVSGTLVDQADGEPIRDAVGKEITAEKEFTAKKAEGDVTVVFEFDGSLLAGKVTVVFEELFFEKKSIAVHADLNDAPQTVKFPEIRTQAVDPKTGVNLTLAADEASVVDTISYRHLIPQKQYHLEGILMDQTTGEPALDADGKKIQAEMDFVPEKAKGEVELTFHFPGKGLENHTFVVFEELSMKKSWFSEVKIAVHRDIEDEAQTIHIPGIHTTAMDDETMTQLSMADEEIHLTDTAAYTNLLPGYEYTMEGILMDKETGEPVKDDNGESVRAKQTFTPKKAKGEVEMTFSLSGGLLAGKTVVFFETLEYDGEPVAKHQDLNASDQTIYFPLIRTTATDKADGGKESEIKDTVTITDRIEYHNLIPGMEYRIAGTVMDKAAKEPLISKDGPVIAEHVFTAKEAEGSVEVGFTFPGEGMEEKELVVFEKLFLNESGKEAAVHEDLEDQGQTVKLVREPKTPVPSNAVNTGDKNGRMMCIYLILFIASGACAVQRRKRRRGRYSKKQIHCRQKMNLKVQ